MSVARRNDLIMVSVGAFVVLLDQLTKHWIVQYFGTGAPKGPVPILGHVLELLYTPNTGVAFSLLEGADVKFLFIALAIGVICVLYWRARDTGSLLLKVTFAMILGGAAGNLLDRFTRHYVVDFIHFQIPRIFDFAVFNVADSAISIGVVVLAYLLWRNELGRPSGVAVSTATTDSTADKEPAATPPAHP